MSGISNNPSTAPLQGNSLSGAGGDLAANRQDASSRPTEVAGRTLPSSPRAAMAEGHRSLAKDHWGLRQAGTAALGFVAVVRCLVAVGTLGISEAIIAGVSKAADQIGSKAAPREGINVTLPGGSDPASGASSEVSVQLQASALPSRIPKSMSAEELQQVIQAKINAGQELVSQLTTGTHDGSMCTNEDTTNLMWFLQAKAESLRGSFEEGAFSVEDPGQNIRKFLDTNPQSYQRVSSHIESFQSLPGGAHRGIDCYGSVEKASDLLPNNMKTLLYGTMAGGMGKTDMPVDRIYLKIESHGSFIGRAKGGGDADGPRRFGNRHDVGAFVGHSFSFLSSQGKGSAAGTFKERIPDSVKQDFKNLIETTPEPSKSILSAGKPTGTGGGIRLMIANVDEAIRGLGSGDTALRETLEAFRESVATAKDEQGNLRYDHLECRIGNEIVLQAKDLNNAISDERQRAFDRRVDTAKESLYSVGLGNNRKLPIANILGNSILRSAFKEHLATEYSSENLAFYEAAEEYGKGAAATAPETADKDRAVLAELRQLNETFVKAGSESQVNLPGKGRREFTEKMLKIEVSLSGADRFQRIVDDQYQDGEGSFRLADRANQMITGLRAAAARSADPNNPPRDFLAKLDLAAAQLSAMKQRMDDFEDPEQSEFESLFRALANLQTRVDAAEGPIADARVAVAEFRGQVDRYYYRDDHGVEFLARKAESVISDLRSALTETTPARDEVLANLDSVSKKLEGFGQRMADFEDPEQSEFESLFGELDKTCEIVLEGVAIEFDPRTALQGIIEDPVEEIRKLMSKDSLPRFIGGKTVVSGVATDLFTQAVGKKLIADTARQTGLDDVLSNTRLRGALRTHLASEFSVENLDYLEAVEQINARITSGDDVGQLLGTAREIRTRFIGTDASNQVNLKNKNRVAFEDGLAVAEFMNGEPEQWQLTRDFVNDSVNTFQAVVAERYRGGEGARDLVGRARRLVAGLRSTEADPLGAQRGLSPQLPGPARKLLEESFKAVGEKLQAMEKKMSNFIDPEAEEFESLFEELTSFLNADVREVLVGMNEESVDEIRALLANDSFPRLRDSLSYADVVRSVLSDPES